MQAHDSTDKQYTNDIKCFVILLLNMPKISTKLNVKKSVVLTARLFTLTLDFGVFFFLNKTTDIFLGW